MKLVATKIHRIAPGVSDAATRQNQPEDPQANVGSPVTTETSRGRNQMTPTEMVRAALCGWLAFYGLLALALWAMP
jgi:hypothetical protein